MNRKKGNGTIVVTTEADVYLMGNAILLVSEESASLMKATLTTVKPSCTMPLILTGLKFEVKFWCTLDENIMKMIA
jgi:hypothetical protein